MSHNPPPLAGFPPEPEEHPVDIRGMNIDPEALLLSSLMWVGPKVPQQVKDLLDYLHEADFFNPVHGRIFRLIRAQVSAGLPMDVASLVSCIDASGKNEIWPDGSHHITLANIAGLGTVPDQATWWADRVLAASYRRQFVRMTERLAQISREAPEGELFDTLVELGKAQRQAWERRRNFHPVVMDEKEER